LLLYLKLSPGQTGGCAISAPRCDGLIGDDRFDQSSSFRRVSGIRESRAPQKLYFYIYTDLSKNGATQHHLSGVLVAGSRQQCCAFF
jgi:hypothetical protein